MRDLVYVLPLRHSGACSSVRSNASGAACDCVIGSAIIYYSNVLAERDEQRRQAQYWNRQCVKAEADRDIFSERCAQNTEDIVRLKVQRDRMREALKWYRCTAVLFDAAMPHIIIKGIKAMQEDKGEHARKALEEADDAD